MRDLLDACWIHGDQPCDCPAYLVAMGAMDLQIEHQLEEDPAYGAELLSRLRGRE